MKHSHYFKPVAGLEHIDVYRTLLLFGVTDPCLQHAIKKLLVAGGRGAKDISQDVQEAIDTLERWKTMRQEEDQPARRPMTPNMISYPAVEVGSDVDFDGARVNRVANSHGDGEHYAELAIQQGGNGWLPIEGNDVILRHPSIRYDVKFEDGHIARDVTSHFVTGGLHGAKLYRQHVPGETDA